MELIPKISRELHKFTVVDSHTMGEPTRVVLSGFPEIPGATMMEKKQFLIRHYDHYRTALMLEPRGHRDMFGAVFTEPVHEEAQLGVIFMDSGGYLNMCGHGTIGSATVAVEAGLVPVTEPDTEVVLDTPAGLIRTKVKVKDKKAIEVSLINVPAFVYRRDLQIPVEGYGVIPVDISFGGSFFALVDSAKLGRTVTNDQLEYFVDLGMKLIRAINETVEIHHPYLDIHTVDLAEFYGEADDPEADLKNVVVFGDAQADRSPCGTGTTAKLAYLYQTGKLALRQPFVYESITGSKFKGMVLGETQAGGYPAVIVQVTGSAYITGVNTWMLDDEDPLEYGFLMGEGAGK